MKCPDCDLTMWKEWKPYLYANDAGAIDHYEIYKCPKCKQEYEPEELEDEA